MAPSPETDNTPKAPDKVEKGKCTRESEPRTPAAPSAATAADNDVKEIAVTSLDDVQLKALLDEAITYKTPRDREGKSELFKTLLTDAEDDLRKDLAKTASGSELARYYNTTANRRRSKRQPSSISENLTHGGSLNDLAKEELYESANHLQRPKKTVSARQREGGSLPCNVNAGASYDKQFFLEEQAKRRNNISEKLEYTAIDIESEFLLENDSLGQEYGSGGEMEVVQTRLPRIPNVYTSKATLQITGVDDYIQLPFERGEKGSGTGAAVDDSYKHMQDMTPHYGILAMNSNKYNLRSPVMEEKKVDENGNALAQNSAVDTKKRKKSGKKAEGVMKAEDVKGHRADIIDDIEMLLEFISGTEEKSKTSVKSKLHKHMSEDKGKQHKQRTRSSKGTKAAGNHHHVALQKSNSLEEVSTTKLEDFHFDSKDHMKSESSKAPLRSTKSNADRPRERKSWVLCSELYQNASAENLESADFTFVTKKKKSKKRRNSLGSRKQVHVGEVRAAEFHRVPSPRRKSVCSAPHSEKSIDSSDADSVNSLSMDYADMEPLNQPVSYADIAKSAEKQKCSKQTVEKKKSPEKPVKVELVVVEPYLKTARAKPEVQEPVRSPPKETVVIPVVNCLPPKPADVPPQPVSRNDLNSLQNWPEIRNNKVNTVKRLDGPQEWPTIQNNNGFKDSSNSDNKLKNMTVPRTNKLINNVRNNKHPQKPMDEQESSMQTGIVKENNLLNSTHQVLKKVSEEQKFDYQCQMPPNIRDVQSIEKMQYKSLHNISFPNNGSGEPACLEEIVQTPNSVATPVVSAISTCEVDKRPAVVILSGADKHISDITFGFDINEQLLSGDVCADFMSRFYVPETPQAVHIEKLVDYIGTEWEDVLVQTNGGKVKYYTDEL